MVVRTSPVKEGSDTVVSTHSMSGGTPYGVGVDEGFLRG